MLGISTVTLTKLIILNQFMVKIMIKTIFSKNSDPLIEIISLEYCVIQSKMAKGHFFSQTINPVNWVEFEYFGLPETTFSDL